jgi:putative ABC transport system permease protein
MDTLRQDLGYALRRLRQAPAFTLVAVATLALGIGANGAIFSVVNAVLLRPLPFGEPERLVRLSQTWKGEPGVYSPQNFLDVQTAARSFESLAVYDSSGVTLTGRGQPVSLRGTAVSTTFFDVLRVPPAYGRAFEAGENEPGRTKVAVLGHRLWRERFAGDPRAVGQTVQIHREPFTIVGIAPAGFTFPEATDIWTPLEYDARFRSNSRGAWYLGTVGRLRPESTIAQAREEVAAIHTRLAREFPNVNEGVGATVTSLQEAIVGDARGALLLLLGAVGLVLLIACVNVANLLLARVTAREGEFALRTALGAGRFRLVRQLLTESLTLSVLGGLAGILVAAFSLDALLALQPEGVPRLAEVKVDRAVVAFAAVLSVVVGLVFGVVPAHQMTRRTTADSLREGSRGVLSGRGQRMRSGLVIGQMALAMMLLAGAGLLLRSFTHLRRVDPGFRSENVLTFRLSLPDGAYKEDDGSRALFYDRLVERLAALPGVRSAGAVMHAPLTGANFNLSFEVKGRPPLPPAQQPSMEIRVATPDYFSAMRIPVLRGRPFEPRDVAGAPQVVVLSEAAARRHFPGEDPMGKFIVLGWGRGEGEPSAGGEVVGIVGDVRDQGLAREKPAELYVAYAQVPIQTMDVVVRADVSPRSLVPSVERIVRDLDPELPIARVATLEEVVARSISEPRFYTVLLGAFAAMAVFLAALGIFGVLSYAVVQRSREIGIRVALGAHPGDVLWMVLAQAASLAAIGVLLGLAGTLALSRAIGSLLFELSPTDPATLAATAALLGTVALLASYLPARRATRVDPVIALRSE